MANDDKMTKRRRKPFQNVLGGWKFFLVSVMPVGFIVSGGIATIDGRQSTLDFFCVYVWYALFQFRLFDWIIGLEKEKSGEEAETQKQKKGGDSRRRRRWRRKG